MASAFPSAAPGDPSPSAASAVVIGVRWAGEALPEWAKDLIRRGTWAAERSRIVLLMLAAGALLLRPSDLVPALAGAPIYEVLIAACLLVSLPRLWAQVSGGALRRNAIAALVLAMVPAVMLSHLAHADTYDARLGGLAMAKACLFFLLLIALVDTPSRFRIILWTAAAAILGMTMLALLQHHGVLHLEALRSIEQRSFDSDEESSVMRLCGIGVFDDPNDFALILVVVIVICVYGLGERRAGSWRWLLLGPLAMFTEALVLTHSRGGAISAAAALLAYIPARFGWRNSLVLVWLLVPVLLLTPSWGRQTTVDVDNPEDTFQTRLDLWSQSIEAFRSAPILGIGQGKLLDLIGHVAHNSYLHAFAELGVVGGVAFLGAFFLIVRGVWMAWPTDGELARLRPYVLALTVGYGTGILALSRTYTVPTQLVLGLGTVFVMLASRCGRVVLPRMSWRCVGQVSTVSGCFLVATYVFVRVMLIRGTP